GLLATATVKTAGLFFGYDGTVALPADGSRNFDGEVRVAAHDLGDAMAIAGLGSGGALRGSPVFGSLKVGSAAGAFELKPYKLTIGGRKCDGTIAPAYPERGLPIVSAQMEVGEASIPGLLGIVLDRRAPPAVAATAAQPRAPVAAPAAEPLTA